MQKQFWRKFWMFTWWSHQILYHGWVFWFLYHIGLGAEISAFDIYFSLNLCLVFIQAYPVCKLYGHSLTGRWLGWSEINYQSIGFISGAYKLNICTSLYITESVKSSSPLCVLVGRHSSVRAQVSALVLHQRWGSLVWHQGCSLLIMTPKQKRELRKAVYTSLAPGPSKLHPQVPEDQAGCYTQRLSPGKFLRVGSCFQPPLLECSK